MNTAFLLFWIIGSIVAFIGGLKFEYLQTNKITLTNLIFWGLISITTSWIAAIFLCLLCIYVYLDEKSIIWDTIILSSQRKGEEKI